MEAEEFPQILRQHFDAGHVSFMEPYPELLETFIKEEILCPFHHGKFLLRNGFPIGEAGGHAGEGGLAPGRKTRFFGQGPDVGLVEAGVAEGTLDAKLRKGFETGAVLGGIVQVGAVDDMG